MKRLPLLIPIILIALSGCISTAIIRPDSTPMPTPAIGQITGKVIASKDGIYLDSANINTDPPTSSVTTDAKGNYTITSVPSGHYTPLGTRYIRVILYSSNLAQGVIYWDEVILTKGE